ncbi:5-oxoprolinase subunit PxpB [Lutibacter sp.]|uniref:5-oxoprolinase subunit PxpB n=1 Tax=Lutibacter sp. TaxID=1925666 RepID=UPI0027351B19|nr:5-oxoprolinase subunit PxpB [Lutibacter sp.]MDP3313374.1 5-oxoprolinase subunit PxpB [Lutibacter sp.]
MGNYKIHIKQYSPSAVLIEWPSLISKEILEDISNFSIIIRKNKTEQIVDINFVYCSLLIIYNKKIINFNTLKSELQELYSKMKFDVIKRNNWNIPVCYDLEFGIDLSYISTFKQLEIKQIIEFHINQKYTVYGIGFLPGFLYLGELNQNLIIPRRDTPRNNVDKGSVAIAGNQTGIYPQNSPGGWHVIGKTPIQLFNAFQNPPIEIMPNDTLQFYQISKKEYFKMIHDPIDIFTFLQIE